MAYHLFNDQKGLRLLVLGERQRFGGKTIWVLLSDGTASGRADIFVPLEGSDFSRLEHFHGTTLAKAWQFAHDQHAGFPKQYPAGLKQAIAEKSHHEKVSGQWWQESH